MLVYTPKQIERFWSHVDKENSNTFYNGTRCWEWALSCDRYGYGQVTIGNKHQTCHQVAYKMTHGEIPKGFGVLHYCDNPICCNPAHFRVGTHQENMADMVHKERAKSKEKHWNSRLSESQVLEIRKRYAPLGVGGESAYRLAKVFGVTKTHISNIVKNKAWK